MALMNAGLKRLNELKPTVINLKKLPACINEKVKSTAEYSLANNPMQEKSDVLKRCRRAIPAEYIVANWVKGFVNNQEVDHENNDPFEWAYDVLAHPDYSGMRIEVKTHYIDPTKKKSHWINVTTGIDGPFPMGGGINIAPALNYKIADVIIFFVITEVEHDVMEYTPILATPVSELTKHVNESQHEDGGGFIRYRL